MDSRSDLRVFVRALHPDEGLQIDHVARFQIALVAPDGFGELEQTRVSLPVRLRFILKIEAVFAGRDFRYVRFEKDMAVGLGDESKYGHERPGQHACLFSRQGGDGLAPGDKSGFIRPASVQKIVETLREQSRAGG